MNHVAVYGTLKEGYYNYELYLSGRKPRHALFVELPFRMFACDEYPMLVPVDDDSLHRTWIEVFEVDDAKLAELDALEAPYGYWREAVHVAELSRTVELYLHPAPAPAGFVPVATGDWKEESSD